MSGFFSRGGGKASLPPKNKNIFVPSDLCQHVYIEYSPTPSNFICSPPLNTFSKNTLCVSQSRDVYYLLLVERVCNP